MSTKRGLIALSIQESSAGGTYYLVREDMLPEGVLKTVRAKQLLATGEAKTVYEAVERAGLSRSAFYKYKDGVHELNRHEQSRLATVSMELHHRSGVLSNVLLMIAAWQGNVLTIHQTIPLQGMANVVVTIDTSGMKESLGRLLEELRRLDGVKQADWIGHG
ncbi:ACT domain-containing protein [Xylanibacillus composti]|nr:ACT domain-containing protein [Xylanibacillus composti]